MTERLSTETDNNGVERKRSIEIAHSIDSVRERISAAAERSGRKADDITLVAVTKTMPAKDVATALSCGIRIIGENRVQELLQKLPELDMQGRQAHMIGHMQTNKVRQIIDKVDMIQSVDSLHLAAEIEKQAHAASRCMDILCEVNIGAERSKSGVSPEALPELLEGISSMKHIRVCGLMAIPPQCDEEKLLRQYFIKMRNLFIDIGKEKSDNISMRVLSMGMSSDFETAIEEGATMVRVGTSIFGSRI